MIPCPTSSSDGISDHIPWCAWSLGYHEDKFELVHRRDLDMSECARRMGTPMEALLQGNNNRVFEGTKVTLSEEGV